MEDKLQTLIDLQREQNQLLKRYLWRFRFSLMALLLLTTATAIGLGLMVYQNRPKVVQPTPTTPPVFNWSWGQSTGTLFVEQPAEADKIKLFEQPHNGD